MTKTARDQPKTSSQVSPPPTPSPSHQIINKVLSFHAITPFGTTKDHGVVVWNDRTSAYEPTHHKALYREYLRCYGVSDQELSQATKIHHAIDATMHHHHITLAGKEWVQCGQKLYNVYTGAVTHSTPSKASMNPLPWNPVPGSTPRIDALFHDWVGDHADLLKDVLSFCMIRDYPLSRIIALVGSGRNGKSTFLNLTQRFLGRHNTINTDYTQLMTGKYASAELHGKLAAIISETPYLTTSSTERLKQLTGNDTIMGERKYQDPFTFKNYAKLIIASNGLPPTNDETDGFYRRWLIIPFNNQFDENPQLLDHIEDEFPALTHECLVRAKTLLEEKQFLHEGGIAERRTAYQRASNPFYEFVSNECLELEGTGESMTKLFKHYKQWLTKNKHRTVTRKEFRDFLNDNGFDTGKTILPDGWAPVNCVYGIKLKNIMTEVRP